MDSPSRGCEVWPLLICDNPISSCLSLKVCTCKYGPVLLCRCGRKCLYLHFRGTTDWRCIMPYNLESNPHTFYSFRGLKNQMRIRIACGLDSRSWAGFWKNDRAAVHAVRTIQYNNLLFYLLLIILYNILWPASWPSGHSLWLLIMRSGFDSRFYRGNFPWRGGFPRWPWSG